MALGTWLLIGGLLRILGLGWANCLLSQFGDMLCTQETGRRIRRRVLGKSLADCSNEYGVLGFAPALARKVNAWPMPRLSSAYAATVDFYDSHAGRIDWLG